MTKTFWNTDCIYTSSSGVACSEKEDCQICNIERRENTENIRSCPACLKSIVHQEPRYADMPPIDVVPWNKSRVKHLIGRIYYHKDGTICDETLCRIEDLRKPKYLRLGDSHRDPRT